MKILLVSSLLLLALCTPALAASPAAPPTFGEAVEVNVVNVDVAATDSRGHRVTGLRKDDFELLEDGKRVAISDFDSFDASVSASQRVGPPAGAGKAPEESSFNLVVYFDDVNIRPAHRARVLKQLDEFLARQLAPLATLFYGFEENPLGVTVEVGEPVAAEGGEYAVPLRLRIPLFKLALLNRDEAYNGKLRFLVATRDETGGASTVHQVEVPLHIPHKEVLSALGQYYLYTLTVQMKPGTQHFAVAVQDELATSTSYLSRPVTVAATAAMSYP